jgi:predicted RNA methylase
MDYNTIFENNYPGAETFTQNCFEPVFGSIQKARKSLNELLSEVDKSIIKDIFILGSCANFSFGEMNFFDVTLQDKVDIARSRVIIQRAVRKALDIYQAAIVIFHYGDNHRLWRLSFIHREGSSKDTTSAKRYSYLCGKERYCRTVADRFNELERIPGKKRLEDVTKVFSIEALTKEFFSDLFKWYDTWAVHLVKFPAGKGANAALPKKPDVEKNRQHLIRLITRLIFVWFLKQKENLVPGWLFDKDEIAKALNNFNAHSEKQGNYYNGIIQNLFFATLNKPIKERKFANMEEDKRVDDYSIKTVFRDFINESLFSNDYNPAQYLQKFIDLFNPIPFLNGGLFECLDNFDTKEYVDGFSREEKRAAFVPNCLFWGDKDHEGLIPLLSRFNFTIEENTPQDIDIALDPELLGKVFENLLGTYNEETSNTARKESGSFYTPREIVDYMVDTSLKEYFKGKLDSEKNNIDEKLDKLFLYNEPGHDFDNIQVTLLMDAVNECKILDPACGSGAFPMGVLNKLAFVMQKLDPQNEIWRTIQIKKVTEDTAKAYGIEDKEKRNDRLNEIKEIFDMSTGEYSNYVRKLFLIENCIYGVDIQPIAIQISKLRFFISLIADQKTGGNIDNNYNVLPLPNLETKFVAANTLIGVKHEQGSFIDPDVKDIYDELLRIRHDHISVSGASEKIELREKDKFLCGKLAKILQKGGVFSSAEVDELLSWNPYNQTKSAGFFDPAWMFALEKENSSFLSTSSQDEGFFDVVIGNPPYGAKLSEKEKSYFLENYQSTKTITGIQKGSTDSFSLFIESGYNLLKLNGNLILIVSMAFISSDSMSALHKLLFKNCQKMQMSSYAKRPRQIFASACIATTILSFNKTYSICNELLTTKLNKLKKGMTLQNLINNLVFTNSIDLCLFGRIPKISLSIEKLILKKLFQSENVPIKQLLQDKGQPIYYRSSGGRYFNVITNYTTGSTKEKTIFFNEKIGNSIGAFLSSNLFYWYQQVYSNTLDLKLYEIESFTIPIDKLSESYISSIEDMYKIYLNDIEKNVLKHKTKSYVNIDTFKEYKIRNSKHLIDQIDDIICPLYGLTPEEIDYIKNYEIDLRLSET